MNEELLTVAEFAKAAGVSKQAIYQRLKKDLHPFLHEINGTKSLSIDALELFPSLPTAAQSDEAEKTAALNALIEQLNKKDKMIEQQQTTIEQQTAQIGQLQEHITKQSSEMMEMLKEQNQLQKNFQVLLKQQQDASRLETTSTNLKGEDDPLDQVVLTQRESTVDAACAAPENDAKQAGHSVDSPPEKKPGFFARLFGW